MRKDLWDAKYYKQHSFEQEESALLVVNSIEFSGSEKVLDIGCGDGRISAFVAKKVPLGTVVGMDPSLKMIKEAKNSFSIPNLFFEVSKAEDISMSQEMDIALSFSAFHWVSDQKRAMKNIYNALKKGGRLYLRAMVAHNYLVREFLVKKGIKTILNELNEAGYQAILEEAGFGEYKTNFIECVSHFDDREALFSHFMAWFPFAMGVEKKMCRDIVREAVDYIAGEETRVPFVWPIINLEAKK